MHGHGHQRADQDGGKELTDERLGDGERAGDRRHPGISLPTVVKVQKLKYVSFEMS